MIQPNAERRAARIALACRLYKARIDRYRFFPSSLLNDAGWDMMLAIYVFGAAGRTLSAGELCQACGETSATSALRLQRRLVDLGLIRRYKLASDRRRLLVELTEQGETTLNAYLDHVVDENFFIPNSATEIDLA